MSDLANGILVQHVSLGVGKVVALEPLAVHVFFPAAEQRFATKLRLPDALRLLRTDGVAADGWLLGLSAFALDPETRRYALAESWVTHAQAIAQFVASYPDGFADPRHAAPVGPRSGRAPRWRAAREAWVRALGGGEGDKLVAAGDLKEIVKRTLAVEKLAHALYPDDTGAFAEAFADAPATELFFQRLFELLSVPSPSRARFDRLFAAAAALAPHGAAWRVATLLPFLADPTRHVLVSAGTSAQAARRLGCDLRWDDAPNWATYAAFRTLSVSLLDELRPIGARDHVDVETFLHATAASRTKPASKAGARRPTGGSARRAAPAQVRAAAPARAAAASAGRGARGRRPSSTRQQRRAR
jgi:hypothetical protein